MKFLCIDPRWEGGTPPDELIESEYEGVRFVAFPELWPAVGKYLNMGKHVVLVLARESGDPEQYADWGSDPWFRDRMHWVIGNEPDGSGEASWIMTPDEYAALWERSRCLPPERWVAGVCSGNVGRALEYLPASLDEAGLTIHLYGLSPDEVAEKIWEYQELGVPLWVGEWHEATGFKAADYEAAFGDVWQNYFCYSDAMVDGFGLAEAA